MASMLKGSGGDSTAATAVMPTGGKLYDVSSGAVGVAAAVVAFGVVAYALDKDDLRTTATRIQRFGRLRP